MIQKFAIRLIIMGMLLLLGLPLPVPGQTGETGAGSYAEQREQLLSDLKLSSDKVKAFMSVGGHWDQIRQELIARD